MSSCFCRNSTLLQWLLCVLSMLILALPGVAAEMQEQRMECGNYSAVIPQGFVTHNMPQPYDNHISLKTNEYSFAPDECSITCIRREKKDDRTYLIETIPLVFDSLTVKTPLRYHPIKYKGALPSGLNVYYGETLKSKNIDEVGWSTALIEMSAEGSMEHVILFYRCFKDYHTIPQNGRPSLLVEMTYDELRERIMNIVRSIRKKQ